MSDTRKTFFFSQVDQVENCNSLRTCITCIV